MAYYVNKTRKIIFVLLILSQSGFIFFFNFACYNFRVVRYIPWVEDSIASFLLDDMETLFSEFRFEVKENGLNTQTLLPGQYTEQYTGGRGTFSEEFKSYWLPNAM